MQAKTRLPLALAAFGLLRQDQPRRLLNGIRVVPEPDRRASLRDRERHQAAGSRETGNRLTVSQRLGEQAHG